jgi:PleD family two-component response regulator
MADRVSDVRPPLVLIVDDHEWSTRSLESILAPSGYAVMRAYTWAKGLERARAERPDLVVIDANLPDGDGLELCRTLRDDPQFRRTPLLVTAADHPSRQERLEAMRAGAWDFIAHPFDPEEMLLRLGAYVRAKLDTDRLRDDCLVDEETGLYNQHGLERRARELGSQAFRSHGALACVVFAPMLDDGDEGGSLEQVVTHLAKTFRSFGRVSDAIGRLGKTEFAVLAPATNGDGARQLAERLGRAVRESLTAADIPVPEFELRAGIDAVPNVREAPLGALDLLGHAATALRRKSNGEWISEFETAGTVNN